MQQKEGRTLEGSAPLIACSGRLVGGELLAGQYARRPQIGQRPPDSRVSIVVATLEQAIPELAVDLV